MFGLGSNLMLYGALVFALFTGYGLWHHKVKAEGAAECQAAHDKADRAEEQRRTAALAEASNEAQRMANRARADARGADAAAVGLRGAVAARLHVPSAPASGASAPAGPGTDMLADVLGKAETRLRDLARIADEAHNAGLACERSYEALTP